ncbi:MAG: glycosyltransferase, partial [Candidatus Hadarchaeales archaeon]
PAIAVDEGGFRYTIVHERTGILIKPPYVKNLVAAIKNFEKYSFEPPEKLRKRAMEYSEEKWVDKIKKVAKELLANYQKG